MLAEKDFSIPTLEEHIRVVGFGESASQVLPPAVWNYLQTGAEVIALAADKQVAGNRDQDRKSIIGSPQRLTPGQPNSIYPNLFDLNRFKNQLPRHRKVLDPALDPELTWEDADWLLSIFKLPITLNSVLHPLDVVRLSKFGFPGLVVSNQGGHNLDGGISALRQLPTIRGT